MNALALIIGVVLGLISIYFGAWRQLYALVETAASTRRRAEIAPRPNFQPPETQAELGRRYQGRPAPLEPWTPAEREAFGVDETDTWIAATQRVLNDLEWRQIRAEVVQAKFAENFPPGWDKRHRETVEVHAWGEVEPIATYE